MFELVEEHQWINDTDDPERIRYVTPELELDLKEAIKKSRGIMF